MNPETKKPTQLSYPELVALSKKYSASGSYAREISSNADVTGNLNSQFKYNQSDDGPWQEMSKGASFMDNKYLQKIASLKMPSGFAKAYEGSSKLSKVSLGLSMAGLGLSAANFHNSSITAKTNMDKANLERKSLTALNNINKTLSTAQIHPSPISTNTPSTTTKI